MKGSLEPALNPNQKKAVLYNDGPLLIVAGAGTGKTFTLVEKIKYLIAQGLAKPEEILCLTFTEKAAHEMEERVDQALPYGYFQMWISTFHSFADEILRAEAGHIGLPANYTLMTQAQSVVFLRKHLYELKLHYFRPLGNPNKFLDDLLQHFSRLRDEDISPEQYLSWVKGISADETLTQEEKEKYFELASAYDAYQKIKVKESQFDFADLIGYLLTLFRERPSLLQQYQKQFRYVLVDEFQDTNIAQYQLVKLLCPPEKTPKLTVVGDDSQAIYKFRGASISNILTFMKDYSKATQITLNDNYRSNQTILDSSHLLIQENNPDTLETQLNISKKLTSHKPNEKEAIIVQLFDRVEDESDFVVKEILSLQKKAKYQWKDFAILVRANKQGEPFLNALSRNGIPYQFLGPGMLFKQPEIKDVIAYLKVLANIEDSVSFYRVLSMELFKLDPQDVNLLLAFAKKTAFPLYQATELYAAFFQEDWYRSEFQIYRKYLPLLRDETKTKLITLLSMIKGHLARLKTDSAGQILFSFLEETGYLKIIAAYKTEREEKIALNITKFFDKLKALESQQEDRSVFAVVEFLDISLEMGESPLSVDNDAVLGNAVNILTVHGAKGLEFPVVFLPNLIRGRFPTYEKKEAIPIPLQLIKELLPTGDYHLQEERRLFYVGLTRAMDRVYLLASRFYSEGKRERKPSPFIAETVGEEAVKNVLVLKQEEKSQLSIFDFQKQPVDVVTKEPLNLRTFSYSQLESFKVCPLQYKYQYILKIPTTPNAAASFGSSIHKSLQQFYEQYMQTHNGGLTELLAILDAEWIPLGYSSLAQQTHAKEEGKKMLTKFYESFHQPHIDILDLEKLFKIRIGDDVFITGKIDRVDRHADGTIEVIDYKTGKKPDEKELQKSLQLSIYAMAATNPALYRTPIEKVTLTFYYLQSMEKISMKRSTKDIETIKQEISEAVQTVRKSSFPAQKGPWCQFCSFRMICEAWQ